MRGEASGASARDGVPAPASPARGRLFRRYFVLILALVTSALVVSGAIGLWFSYQETLAALYGLQREKAVGAAERIRGYVENIQSQLRGAALPQLGAEDGEQRRVEFLRLLKQVPEVTDLGFIAADGCERVQVSRLAMDAIGECLGDRAKDPAFAAPTPSKPWYGPVTFRKETEPYMTIAVRSGGPKGPVTWADVNLKFMWDVISRIRVGETGKAYVIDRTGHLIADPDIGLVLRKSDLSTLAHVAGALAGGPDEEAAVVTTDATGRRVLAAHAPIEPLGWTVFVEQPVAEATAQLRAYVLRTLALIAGGLFFSALAAMFLARGMAKPIGVLQEGAQRIGSGELDHRIDIRTGDELEALAGRFNDMTAQLRESYAGLERKVDERTRELANALEQQTAISGILRVISSSPTDVKPVLEAVAERAAHLCAATYARVLLVDGAELDPIAGFQDGRTASDAQLHDTTAVPYDRTSLTGRAAIERRTIHEADIVPLLATEYPGARANMEQFGLRAVLVVPLVRESGAYGGIILARTTPGRFRDDQVELVETFARQAAIAIDNVRLFNETKEALEQQTAISEVLRVISSTPGDVKPMLQAVAERSLKLCDAAQATIVLVDGEQLRCHAAFGETRSLAIGETMPLTRGSVAGRAVIDGVAFQVGDLAQVDEAEFPVGRELQRRVGHHTALAVPLMREGRAIGAIQLWRMEARPFTEKKVDLVRTFADQATLAIENVRLFNETKEALEQQQASAEVLSVISSSVADARPVFERITASCARLFGGTVVGIPIVREDGQMDLAAYWGPEPDRIRGHYPRPADDTSGAGTAILRREVGHYPDIDAPDVPPAAREALSVVGVRAAIFAPMIWEGRGIGAIWVGRAAAGPFAAKEIELLRTFANQAVIAIQNARLFNETKEALEQQKASSEVLSAISSSIADTGPVFDKILASCESIFGGKVGLVNLMGDDGMLRLAAYHGQDRERVQAFYPVAYEGSMTQHAVATHGVAHFPDIERAEVGATSRKIWKTMNVRAVIGAPFLWEGRCIGSILIGRGQAGPFSDKEQALLKTFADQAVIAIQNARLVNETREALEQQKASAEVLSVISSSIADTTPVFEKILASCERLFAGQFAGVNLVGDDGLVHMGAYHGQNRDRFERLFPLPIDASGSGIAILERRVVHYPDVMHDPGVPEPTRAACIEAGYKSVVFAPMMWEGRAIGVVYVGRDYVGPFSEKDIALLRTFADQAVIAIQNARLVNETNEALERQTATAEVLQVISSSVADTAPVFDKILASGARLFATEQMGIFLARPDGMVEAAAFRGSALEAIAATFPKPLGESITGHVVRQRRVIQVEDAAAMKDAPATVRDMLPLIGNFSGAWAPMAWEGQAIGSIGVLRQPPQPLNAKEVELLKTFADQAVIAIQNARLVNETREALEQQTATADVLKTISRTAFEIGTVLDTLIDSATRLCRSDTGAVYLRKGDRYAMVACHGATEAQMDFMRAHEIEPGAGTAVGMVAERGQIIHFDDAREDPDYTWKEAQQVFGYRSIFGVPMLAAGEKVGVMVMWRREVRPFTSRERELVSTFADQAVIAIQNVRLLTETKEALEQQRASSEVLRTISSSIADTSPVFEQILASCERLFAGHVGQINVVDAQGLVHLAAYHGPGQAKMAEIFPFALDERSSTGLAIERRAVLHYPDIDTDPGVPPIARRGWEAQGLRSVMVAPMMWEGRGVGSLFVGRATPGPYSEKEIALLKTFADQAAIAIQNARLFREIADKSRQLEVANKHKSEFLANMSHELRTPLNAIIGFSEVLLERMFGDLNEKQDDYLKDIHSSGKHLLSLINDILDLSKVEAGRMELEASRFRVPEAIGNAMTLVRERAQRHGIALGTEIAPEVDEIVGDERKFKQILLNLLTNAVKFTPDGGRVDVIARLLPDAVEIAVRDTGIGISADDQKLVFEEFRQVGHDYTRKQEGTGLGLALTRRFVELHGGTIRLESEPGKGSTFTFTLPLAPAQAPVAVEGTHP